MCFSEGGGLQKLLMPNPGDLFKGKPMDRINPLKAAASPLAKDKKPKAAPSPAPAPAARKPSALETRIYGDGP